jgi:hypothetical protein
LAPLLCKNPYTNRAAIRSPEDFFGRVEELRNIYTRIQGGQSVSLVGERRVGKSSLLNALEFEREGFEIPSEFTFVPVDMQYIPDCNPEIFQKYLLSRISEIARIEVGGPSRSSLEQAAKDLEREGRRLVVILDEFDVLVHNSLIPIEFFSFLRSWATQFQIPFVVASREGSIDQVAEDDKTGSAFLNIFGTIYVGPLKSDDAEELIASPSYEQGIEFTGEEVELILSLAGLFPLFLQIACYHLFDLKISGQFSKEVLNSNFAFEAIPHFSYLLKRLTDMERSALRSFLAGEHLRQGPARADLTRKGILIELQGKTRIFSTVFAELIQPRESQPGAFQAAIGKLLE